MTSRRTFMKTSLAVLGSTAAVTSKAGKKSKIVIVGGGLAGLNCARLLQEGGHEPVVLEAYHQAGGRTRSQTVDGITVNLGGIEIGDGYQRFVSLCDSLGLSTYEPKSSPRGSAIYLNDSLIDGSQWPDFAGNALPEGLRTLAPQRLQFALHGKEALPLGNTTDWFDEKFNQYDISEAEFLRKLGADEEALKLIDRAGNFNSIDTVSALHVLRAMANYKYGTSTKTLRVSGGNVQLALAMANQLSQFKPNHKVSKISGNNGDYLVECQNGSLWQAEVVVLALPFSVLREIDLSVDIRASQRQAIDKLPYTKISKLVARIDKPFWEADGLPATLWSDSDIERGFLSYSEDGVPLYNLFINGTGTATVDGMVNQAATKYILSTLATIRPSTEGVLTPLVYQSWGNDPLARGAYHHYAPGQISAFADSIDDPDGQLYYAGEHCARATPGMEGALESGETVAKQILVSL